MHINFVAGLIECYETQTNAQKNALYTESQSKIKKSTWQECGKRENQ